MFSGKTVFELKATHGLPLDVSVDRIIVQNNMAIDWPEFIRTARKNLRWDFQTISDIENALMDADVDRNVAAEIVTRCKLWVMQNPI
ncbi:hypothetical protein JA33_042 [Dickeya phage vB_DsoM_JA33]|uniref:Uncharacterized protein n=3 Tax=Salmondvirus JA11 TaxID=2734141 RepID=A0A384ZW25_9CAUD|nr:hypothetical protein HOU32_gp042 [Dickeya phage vB_DsoM_JA11]AXG66447.1 hypothetical protein JA13_044 [Dickeya phage vB_DsoM_JA13]AXG67416.1 hypothetical protein JA33_042 [Dickeya phage vB_DsoM_JA33]AYD79847.1 hypothetical protein JA11_042 [Dickeya phage vB_DsoM_JA11]